MQIQIWVSFVAWYMTVACIIAHCWLITLRQSGKKRLIGITCSALYTIFMGGLLVSISLQQNFTVYVDATLWQLILLLVIDLGFLVTLVMQLRRTLHVMLSEPQRSQVGEIS